MENLLYVTLLEKTATYKRMNKAAVIRHVDNIRKLDDDGNMELCGVLRKCPGFAGMIILKANSYEEAQELCEREPLVIDGYCTYKLMSLQVGNRENNYWPPCTIRQPTLASTQECPGGKHFVAGDIIAN